MSCKSIWTGSNVENRQFRLIVKYFIKSVPNSVFQENILGQILKYYKVEVESIELYANIHCLNFKYFKMLDFDIEESYFPVQHQLNTNVSKHQKRHKESKRFLGNWRFWIWLKHLISLWKEKDGNVQDNSMTVIHVHTYICIWLTSDLVTRIWIKVSSSVPAPFKASRSLSAWNTTMFRMTFTGNKRNIMLYFLSHIFKFFGSRSQRRLEAEKCTYWFFISLTHRQISCVEVSFELRWDEILNWIPISNVLVGIEDLPHVLRASKIENGIESGFSCSGPLARVIQVLVKRGISRLKLYKDKSQCGCGTLCHISTT